MSFHRNLTGEDNHQPHFREYANGAARTGDATLLAEHVGKQALQLDTFTLYILQDTTPTWVVVGGGAGGGVAGPDTAIQFNESAVLAGVIENTWDNVAKRQQVLGDIGQAGGDGTTLYTPQILSSTATGLNPRWSRVQGNYLYVSDSNDNDLRIFDVTDPAAPVLISTTPFGGCRAFDVAGDLVFCGDEDNGGRLVVINAADKSAPVIIGILVTGGSPRSVRVAGSLVLMGFNTGADGVASIDVTDPTQPVLLDQLVVAGAPRPGMDISGTLLFLGMNGLGAIIIDFSDPLNLSQVTTFPGAAGTIYAVKVQGRYAYMAPEGGDDLRIYDVSDPALPVQVSSTALVAPSSVRGIIIAGNYLYLVDASNANMLVFDVSDPTAPVLISTPVSVGTNPISIELAGRHSYVTDNNGDEFHVIDVSGIDAQNLNVGSIDAGRINVRTDVKMGGSLSANAGAFGSGGLAVGGPLTVAGAKVARAPLNVVEVFFDTDFPNDGSVISPVAGVEYVLMRPISTTMQIAMPATGGSFTPTVIRSTSRALNTLTSTGSGTAFILDTTAQGQLVLQNLVVQQVGGARVFATIESLANQTDSLLELDDISVFNFDAGSTLTNCIFNVNNESFLSGNGTLTLIDCECNLSEMFSANFSDTMEPTFDVRSSSGSVQPSFFSARNLKLSSQANEAFFMLHSNLIAGTIIRLNGIDASPFTPSTGAFYDTQTASITALANSGGAPGVRTVVSAAGHNVVDGDTVIHTGFTTETQLNGTFLTSDVVPGVSYEVVALFGGTDTGVSTNPSLDQTSPLLNAFNNPGQPESKTIGSAFVKGNLAETALTVNIWADFNLTGAPMIAGSNISRFQLNNADTGEFTYTGVEPFSGTIWAHISATSNSGAAEFQFRAIKGDNELPDALVTASELNAQIQTAGLVVPIQLVNGERVRLQVQNVDDNSDVTIEHLSIVIQ